MLPPLKTAYPQVLGAAVGISAQELLILTNKERQNNGLSTLKLNDQLTQAAAMKAKDMFANNYWAHNSPQGKTPWVFVKKAGYEYLFAGENLARGFTLSADVVDAWMASKSHKENMLSPHYQDVGFAIEDGRLSGEDTILVVEMFGGKELVSPASPENTEKIIEKSQETVVKAALDFPQVHKQPIIDTVVLVRTAAYTLLAAFIFILLLDMIIVAKKKIIRFVGHNIDHIVYLGLIMLFLLIIGRGLVL